MAISPRTSAPLATKPFRLQDLPGEIRNKIYELILTAAETPPMDEEGIPRVQHFIKPQILQTCRAIYKEGTYVLRRQNLFIKITLSLSNFEIALRLKKVPIFLLDDDIIDEFNHHVLEHDIKTTGQRYRRTAFMILYCDLDIFCQAIALAQTLIPGHDEIISHVVTLVDPYRKDMALGSLPSLLPRGVQEQITTPYRTSLRWFPRFNIEGAIDKSLKTAVLKDIRPPSQDIKPYIQLIETLKAEGVAHFKARELDLANDKWTQAIFRLNILRKGPMGRKASRAGAEVLNKLTGMWFTLCLNTAQLKVIELQGVDLIPEVEEGTMKALHFVLVDARKVPEKLPGNTWEMTAMQEAKLLYREAVCFRLVGGLEMLKGGELAIDTAIRILPHDPELKKERERILGLKEKAVQREYYGF